MKTVKLMFGVSDDLKLKNVMLLYNDTGIKDTKELLLGIANAIITNYGMDKTRDDAQEILNKPQN